MTVAFQTSFEFSGPEPYVEEWTPSAQKRAVVYLAVNKENGKCYIGYTNKSLHRRRLHHLSGARFKPMGKFGPAIRKYGINGFDFHVLSEQATVTDGLAEEARLIALWKPEYNLTAGGLGCVGYRHDAETKVKMKAWHATHEHRPRLGKKRPGSGEKGVQTKLSRGPLAKSFLGRKHTEESKQRMSAALKRLGRREPTERDVLAQNARKGIVLDVNCKPVLCLSDGKAYKSAKHASLAYGFEKSSVSMVANGKRTSVCGLKFVYVEERK